jgi:hypothetical protein
MNPLPLNCHWYPKEHIKDNMVLMNGLRKSHTALIAGEAMGGVRHFTQGLKRI